MAAPDMDVIKEIPGYKVILKAIIKAQIQQLVEQLAAHTDEESVILTASVADGTLSHLGSDSGKGFLEEQEDVKSQFLGFCLKRHHKKLQAEKEKDRLKALAAQAPLPGQYDMGPGPRRPQRMPYHSTPRQQFSPQGGFSMRSPLQRHEPYHIPRPNRRQSFTESSPSAISTPTVNFGAGLSGDNVAMKMEPSDSDNQNGAGSESNTKDDDNTNSSFGTSELSGNRTGENTQEGQEIDPKSVKVEAISESDFELEITGVEPGQSMLSQDNWDPNVSMGMNFDPSQGASGTSADMPGQQGFKPRNQPEAEKGDLSSEQLPFTFTTNACFPQKLVENVVFGSSASTLNDHPTGAYDHQSNCSVLKYVCGFCNKVCASRWKLETHIRIHTGVRPYSCSTCGRSFNVKGNLTSHQRKHAHN